DDESRHFQEPHEIFIRPRTEKKEETSTSRDALARHKRVKANFLYGADPQNLTLLSSLEIEARKRGPFKIDYPGRFRRMRPTGGQLHFLNVVSTTGSQSFVAL